MCVCCPYGCDWLARSHRAPLPSASPPPKPRRVCQTSREDHAQTDRYQVDHDHRRGPYRDRSGLRVRLFRRTGLQGAARRGLSRHPRQLEPGHDHDRPRHGRCHLHRTDHPGCRRPHHRTGTPRRAVADDGRPDRAEHRIGAGRHGRPREVWRGADRGQARRHRNGRRPQAVPRSDGAAGYRESKGHHRLCSQAPERQVRHRCRFERRYRSH